MATVNNWLTSISGVTQPGNYGQGIADVNAFCVKRRYIDCSADGQASGEYYKLFAVEANTLVRTYMITETAEGAADTADLYFVADTDTGAASGTALVSNHDLNTDDTCNAGTVIFTDVAGTICVKPDAALGTCKYWVAMEALKLATTD